MTCVVKYITWIDLLPEEIANYIWRLVYSSKVIPVINLFGSYKWINRSKIQHYYGMEVAVEFTKTGEIVSASDDTWYKTILFPQQSLYNKGVNLMSICAILFGDARQIGRIKYEEFIRHDLNSCGIFNHNIIDTKIKLYALIQYIDPDWEYLGYVDGNRKACRYSIDI